MNFIKKYSGLLIPIGIVIVAVVLFVPTLLTGRSISRDMEASIAQGAEIKSLRSKTPPKAQAEVEKLYQNEHKKDADEILQLARRSTQRELIGYDIFPKPSDTSQQIFVQFGGQFRATVEDLVKGMSALDAPSDIDIMKETETGGGGTGRAVAGSFGGFGVSGTVGTKKGVSDALVDAVCNKRAESLLVYANPNLFSWYGFWENYSYSGLDAALKDCWYSQVAYWIYEDVAATIKNMNDGFDCVYTSPVKRLVGVSFSKPVEYTTPSVMSSFTGSDEPYYITENDTGVLGEAPWTGRICNDEIDVIHFAVGVILDSKSFLPFIKELCTQKEHRYREGYSASGPERIARHNQITVLQSKVEPVDRKSPQHAYYRYGDGAVVQLSLICEYFFNRSAYDRIKPEPVKELLGQSAPKTGDSAPK
jgi:hypothetical protein